MNGDLISREALKKAIAEYCKDYQGFDGIVDIIDNAPSVEPKQGEWRKTIYGFYSCSNCSGYGNPNFFKYCPSCGAKMKGGAV